MGDWIKTRGINGEWGWLNVKTNQFRTTQPVEGTISSNTTKSTGISQGVNRQRDAVTRQTDSYNRRQYTVHNHQDQTSHLVQKHKEVTVDSDGNFKETQADYTPTPEAPMEQVSPEFDLLTLGEGFLSFPKIKSFLRHPTYKTVYHGSPEAFPIQEARMGTLNDFGLHFGDKKIAAEMAGSNGVVYEARIPRPKVRALDIHSNDVRMLDKDFTWFGNSTYDYADSEPILKKIFTKDNSSISTKLNTDAEGGIVKAVTPNQDIHTNLRDLIFKDLKHNSQFQKEADALLKEYRDIPQSYLGPIDDVGKEALREVNRKTAELLNKNGIKTLSYVNNNPYEGAYNAVNYIVTNPSSIYIPTGSFSKGMLPIGIGHAMYDFNKYKHGGQIKYFL